MNVLHLNANSAGGAFVVANRLSEALNDAGVSSHHLVFDGRPGKGYRLWADSYFRKKQAFMLHALEKLDFLRFEKSADVRFAFSHGLTGIDITRHPLFQQADIIHLHWVNKGFISLNGLGHILATGKKVVWTCHDMWPFTGGCYHNRGCTNYEHGCGHCPYLRGDAAGDLSARVYSRKEAMFGSGALKFVTPSAWLRDKALLSRLATRLDIAVIPNGIDTGFFTPGERLQARQSLGLNMPATTKLLCFAAANLSNPYKGFKEFNRMLDVMKANGTEDIEVLVIGENKAGTGFSGAYPVHFTGYVSDPAQMVQCYRAADLYVTTSLEENLPTTIMESLACGTPVAAFRVGGIPEMVEQGLTGVLAESGDADQLAVQAAELLHATAEYNAAIAENCRSKAVTTYAAEAVAQAYLKLYKSL